MSEVFLAICRSMRDVRYFSSNKWSADDFLYILVRGTGDGNTQLEVADTLVLFLDLARQVDNQACAEGSRDELIKSSSEYVKSELCDINLMLGALKKDISVLRI